jgi:uncharacterized membrane protein
VASLLPGLAHLQNLHPLLVHFPLAFLPAAATAYAVAALTSRASIAWAGFWLLALGAVSGAVAAASGLYGEEGVMVARSVRDALLDTHEDLMLGVVGAAAALLAWAALARPMPVKGRALFLLLHAALLAALVEGADYGGRLVYDYNAGGSACGQPIEFTQ